MAHVEMNNIELKQMVGPVARWKNVPLTGPKPGVNEMGRLRADNRHEPVKPGHHSGKIAGKSPNIRLYSPLFASHEGGGMGAVSEIGRKLVNLVWKRIPSFASLRLRAFASNKSANPLPRPKRRVALQILHGHGQILGPRRGDGRFRHAALRRLHIQTPLTFPPSSPILSVCEGSLPFVPPHPFVPKYQNRVHADRTPCRHRHNRHPRGHAFAGAAPRKRLGL